MSAPYPLCRSVRDMSEASESRTTPMHPWHIAAGAKMGDFAGWDMPLEYPSGTVTEHRAVRSGCGIFDVSHMGNLYVVGDEAVAGANRILTNDIDRLSDGDLQYSLLCDESGGVIDMVTDDEIRAAYGKLAALEGVFAEPASAATVAGIIKYAAKGYFDQFTPFTGEKLRLVCILTGHGLKDPDSAIKSAEQPVTVDAEEDPVLEAMQLEVPDPAGV